jgi:hypothetical protein
MMAWLDVGEKVAKWAALLAAAGYLSLRARFNLLGLSATGPVPTEQYLREAAVLLYGLLDRLGLPLSILLLLATAVRAGVRWATRGAPARERADVALQMVATRARSLSGACLFLVVLLSAYLVSALFGGLFQGSDLVVGPLAGKPVAASAWWLDAMALTTAAGALYRAWAVSGTVPPDAVSCWRLTRPVLVALALLLPLAFGRTAKTVAPVAVVQTATGPVCGLLVMDTGDRLSMWRARDGVGEIVTVRSDRVEKLVTGKVEDLQKLARAAAAGTAPDCAVLPK